MSSLDPDMYVLDDDSSPQNIMSRLFIVTQGGVCVTYFFGNGGPKRLRMFSGLNFFEYSAIVRGWAEWHGATAEYAAELGRIAAEEICKTEGCCYTPQPARARPEDARLDARLIV